MPMAFTEQGVAMLSSILNSARAIKVNIQIIRVFTKMREMLLNYKYLFLKLEQFIPNIKTDTGSSVVITCHTFPTGASISMLFFAISCFSFAINYVYHLIGATASRSTCSITGGFDKSSAALAISA